MKDDLLIIANVDQHPERNVKITKFLDVLTEVSSKQRLLSGNCPQKFKQIVEHHKITHIFEKRGNITKIIDFLIVQFYISLTMIRYAREYDTIFLFMGYPAPAIVGWLMRKRVIRYHGGPSAQERGLSTFETLLAENIPNWFSSTIIIPSEGCIPHFELNRYSHKIWAQPFHIDRNFSSETHFGNRSPSVAYVGELSKQKGVDTLIQSVTYLNENLGKDCNLLIGGQGELSHLAENSKYVTFHGWLEHNQVPEILNQVQLFVLPSTSEGLPTVMLESMACGTPVLATPVGGVPDIIEEGENGYFIEQVSAHTLAKQISSILYSSDLNVVSEQAIKTVQDHYTLSATIDAYNDFLYNIPMGEA